MPFRGVTFSGQNVTPKNDGGLYNAHYGDGILWGCSMNISGDDLVIQSGEFIMGGRVVQVDGATNVDLSGRTLQTGYIQVIMNADLTQGEGNQWYPTFVESATTTFPALTKDGINDTGTLYQLQLAVVQISGGNLTSITSSLLNSGLISHIEGFPYFAHLRQISDGTFRFGLAGIGEGGNFSSIAGMSGGEDSNLILFANEEDIEFRPNGVGSTVGRVRIDKEGQIIGAHKYLAKDSTTLSKQISSGSWTEIDSLDLSDGVWDITATIAVRTLGNNTFATFDVNTSSGYTPGRNSVSLYPASGNITYCQANRKIELSSANHLIRVFGQATGTTTVTGCHIRAIRLD